MADAAALRAKLRKADATAPGIHGAAAAMMRHYDHTSTVAVSEWRNALHQSRPDQRLPLLYVANEVLQNSKRNRGNKFLEAFSPILGQSLIFMAQGSASPVVEKIRRTVKIWADRRVFSVRYVNELLRGLEPHRNGGSAMPSSPDASSLPGGLNFSPQTEIPESPPPSSRRSSITSPALSHDASMTDRSSNSVGIGMSSDDDDDDDDDGSLFGDTSGGISLNINVDLDAATAATEQHVDTSKGTKRRRGSNEGTGINGGSKAKTGAKQRKRPTILTTNSLLELWNQVDSLQQDFDHATTIVSNTISKLQHQEEDQKANAPVGAELLDAYKSVLQEERRIEEARQAFHRISQQRRALEVRGLPYLPWLEQALKQDQDDLQFLNKLETDLLFYKAAHRQIQTARDKRLQQEQKRQQQEEERKREQREERERQEFMALAMQKQTEAQPGMVWNKTTGEYQYPNTDEGWRD